MKDVLLQNTGQIGFLLEQGVNPSVLEPMYVTSFLIEAPLSTVDALAHSGNFDVNIPKSREEATKLLFRTSNGRLQTLIEDYSLNITQTFEETQGSRYSAFEILGLPESKLDHLITLGFTADPAEIIWSLIWSDEQEKLPYLGHKFRWDLSKITDQEQYMLLMAISNHKTEESTMKFLVEEHKLDLAHVTPRAVGSSIFSMSTSSAALKTLIKYGLDLSKADFGSEIVSLPGYEDQFVERLKIFTPEQLNQLNSATNRPDLKVIEDKDSLLKIFSAEQLKVLVKNDWFDLNGASCEGIAKFLLKASVDEMINLKAEAVLPSYVGTCTQQALKTSVNKTIELVNQGVFTHPNELSSLGKYEICSSSKPAVLQKLEHGLDFTCTDLHGLSVEAFSDL